MTRAINFIKLNISSGSLWIYQRNTSCDILCEELARCATNLQNHSGLPCHDAWIRSCLHLSLTNVQIQRGSPLPLGPPMYALMADLISGHVVPFPRCSQVDSMISSAHFPASFHQYRDRVAPLVKRPSGATSWRDAGREVGMERGREKGHSRSRSEGMEQKPTHQYYRFGNNDASPH